MESIGNKNEMVDFQAVMRTESELATTVAVDSSSGPLGGP